jgi:dienelactone hydrolase
MRFQRRMLALLLLASPCLAQTPAAVGPDPAEVPLPLIHTQAGVLPDVAALPVRKDLPDVLVMNDGTRVKTRSQWLKRRVEMRRILSYYAVGQMPPAPGNVKGVEVASQRLLDGTVMYRRIHLTFGPARSLSLDIGIFTPAQGGRFPAIILQSGSVPGAPVLPRLPQGANQGRGQDVLLIVAPEQPVAVMPAVGVGPGPGAPESAAKIAADRAEVFRRGYALVVYNPNDCAEDTTLRNPDGSWAFRNTRFFPAYPGYDWGILAAWAWGASRVADYLEQDHRIDATRLVITGASRNGKSSMVAAAFDDRLAGAPVVTGGGGIGAYRFAGARNSETLDLMQKKYPNWFAPNLHQFWGQVEKLPFDEHWFLALAAPRPFIALEGNTDTISLPEAVKASILAAQPVYRLLGVPDRLGVHYSDHGHAFTGEDWTAMLDFFDKTLRGKPVERTFDHFGPGAQ